MLLRFTVSNFASFRDEAVLDMTPAKSRTMKEHIITDELGKRVSVLPLAAIYGANASGKTKLVDAIDCARTLILRGTRPDGATGVQPHRLDPATVQSPSRFEFVLKHDGDVYTYGFVASEHEVHEEWLFAYFGSRESRVFERVTRNGRTHVEVGARLMAEVKKRVFIDVYAQGTRPNQLFLTEAHERNIEVVKPTIHWFQEHLQIVRPHTQYRSLALRAQDDEEFARFLGDFLRIADTGIGGVRPVAERLDPTKHFVGMPSAFRQKLEEQMASKQSDKLLVQSPGEAFTIHRGGDGELWYVRLTTVHESIDGRQVEFDTTDESDGTRRLMDLAPMLLDVWGRDRVFIIDELDRSLHTGAARLFLEACIAGVPERGARGQFIFTTHDTNLLDRDLLRRDEVWFIEKDRWGASHLTSLAEYSVSDGLNYENGYLNGRFGAIPFTGDVHALLRKGNER